MLGLSSSTHVLALLIETDYLDLLLFSLSFGFKFVFVFVFVFVIVFVVRKWLVLPVVI
jgi:hypothetical protein